MNWSWVVMFVKDYYCKGLFGHFIIQRNGYYDLCVFILHFLWVVYIALCWIYLLGLSLWYTILVYVFCKLFKEFGLLYKQWIDVDYCFNLQTIRWSRYLDYRFDLRIYLINEEWFCLWIGSLINTYIPWGLFDGFNIAWYFGLMINS